MRRAGEMVLKTGLYRINHQAHRTAHEAILWEGEIFPACRHCGEQATFHFLHPVTESDDFEHIGYDGDFLEAVLGDAGSCHLSA